MMNKSYLKDRPGYFLIIGIIISIGVSLFFALQLMASNLKPFKHSVHNKHNLGCQTCHSNILKSKRAEDNNLPHSDFCYNCHSKKIAKQIRFRGSKSKVEFNHFLHTTGWELSCDSCHKYLNIRKYQKGDAMPTMNICGQCHNAQNNLKKCSICHKTKPYFSHINHKKFDIKCITCHPKILKSKSSLDDNIPKRKICDECHSKEFFDVVAPYGELKPNIVFNHVLHGEEIDLKCKHCHKKIFQRYMRYGDALPSSEKCIKCHKRGRISKCTICHNKTAGTPSPKCQTSIETCKNCHQGACILKKSP